LVEREWNIAPVAHNTHGGAKQRAPNPIQSAPLRRLRLSWGAALASVSFDLRSQFGTPRTMLQFS